MISMGTRMAFSTVCAGVVILRYEHTTVAVGANDQQRLLASVVSEPPSGQDNNNGSSPYSPLAAGGAASSGFGSVGYTSSSAEADVASPKPSLWLRLKSSAIFWLVVFMAPCVGFCASLRHTDNCPLPVVIILGLLCIPPVWMISRLPVCAHNLPRGDNFICPAVPWLPCGGIFTNIYLMTSLDIYSYVRIIIWTLLGFGIYFLYGIFHSTLREKMARYERLMQADLQAHDAARSALAGPMPVSNSAEARLGAEFNGREGRAASTAAAGSYAPL
jgi:hypothetical protein